jgi:hypothetical protein
MVPWSFLLPERGEIEPSPTAWDVGQNRLCRAGPEVCSVSGWKAEGEGANPQSSLGYFLPRKRRAEFAGTVTISAEGRRIPQ